jgi:hypothetical protein
MPRALPEYEPRFESPWLKWAQAVIHAQELDELVKIWRSAHTPARSFRAEYRPQRHGFAIIAERVEPMPFRWGLLIGDIANNYRAALDHLAWTLVGRGRTPPNTLNSAQRGNIFFPILTSCRAFNSQIRDPKSSKDRPNLAGIRRADSAIVRMAQPYHFKQRRQQIHPLVLLQKINNGDKHRALHPLWSTPDRFHFDITEMKDCELRGQIWKRHGEPLSKGREVALLPARRTGPVPAIQLKVDLMSTPTIGDRITAREWHARTGIMIFKLLSEFSKRPPDIRDLGGEWAQFDYGSSKPHTTP